ncbi:MAG: hypothetical protein SNJ31_06880 [Rikenellaceae bacterium]
MYQANVYRIMFGSPSDIQEELSIFKEVIYGWNNLHSYNHKVILLPLHWSTNSSPSMTGEQHPQKKINKQVVDKSDLLICVFGSKIGTETDTHQSGTVEEIDEHINAGKEVMIFFKKSINVDIDTINPEQIAKLQEFKKEIQSKGIYTEYESQKDFKDVLFEKLQLFLNENWLSDKGSAIITEPTIEPKPFNDEHGLSDYDIERLKVWTSGDNPQFMQVHFMGGGAIYGLGPSNQYEIKSGKEKIEWDSFFEKLQKLGLIDIERHNKEGHPIYRLKQLAYEYAEKLK